MLTIRDFGRTLSLERLWQKIIYQCQLQHTELSTINVRRKGILDAMLSIGKTSKDISLLPSSLSHDHNNIENYTNLNVNEASIAKWANSARKNISSELDSFVIDGKRWGGHNVHKSLIPSINSIISHCYRTITCLDILIALCEVEKENVVGDCNLNEIITNSARDVHGLAVEKFGVCPDVEVSDPCSIDIGIPSLLHFCFVEIIKNSVRAMIDRYGALDVEDEAPISIAMLVQHDGSPKLKISDTGIGMDDITQHHVFDAFFTTIEAKEPTYTYSRDFGVPFAGAGFGMLRTKTYLELHEANISVESKKGVGTNVFISFQMLPTT